MPPHFPESDFAELNEMLDLFTDFNGGYFLKCRKSSVGLLGGFFNSGHSRGGLLEKGAYLES